MSEFAGYSQVICNKWIDEAKGLRCVLQEGHDGPCRAEPLPAGDDGELCGQLKALARCEHSDLSVAEDAADRIAALNAEVARKDEALAKAASQISDLAYQLGKAQGKLEASELSGIADGWREKCEQLEAEVARLTKRLAVRAQLEKEG